MRVQTCSTTPAGTTPTEVADKDIATIHSGRLPRAERGRKRLAKSASDISPLPNRVFQTYDAVAEAAAKAWNNLVTEVARIASIITLSWAIRHQ
jgi:hypothetical protein